MITNNPNHKKAKIEKILLAGKVAIAISVAGTILTTSVFMYTNSTKREVKFEDHLGNYYADYVSTFEMIKGDIEKKYYNDVVANYNEHLESKKEEEEVPQEIELFYKEGRKDTDIVEVDSRVQRQILQSIGRDYEIDNPDVKITVSDLKQVKSLSIDVYAGYDISWLNYCENLHSLKLKVSKDGVNSLQQIKSLNASTIVLEAFTFFEDFRVKLDDESFSFLRNCDNLSKFGIDSSNFDINTTFLSSLNNDLTLELYDYDNDSLKLDAENLKNCSCLKLNMRLGKGTYDFAYLHTKEEIDRLINSGIEMSIFDSNGEKLENPEFFKEVIGIRNQIDAIVSSLDINDSMSDEEKLKVVLDYVLKNLIYSETSAKIQADEGVEKDVFGNQSDNLVNDLMENTYKDGYLYGALNEKGKPVCGSYAALMKVLLEGVGVEAHFTTSDYHAYNLVNVDGEYYYVDASSLDLEVIDIDEIIKNNKHLIDPNFAIDNYDTNVMPDGVVIPEVNVEEKANEVFYNAKKEYLVKFNNQVISVSFTVLMAILINLGMARPRKKLDEIERLELEEKRKRIRESWKDQGLQMHYDYNPDAIDYYEQEETSGRSR